jgi:hypothetical protein
MDLVVDPRTPPPAGSAQAGDLYVDLQSRTLWLGVDASVDPAQFVLISDILALQDQIAAGDAAERTYVNSQLLLKAPLASPGFTGNPTAPTPLAADNDTSIATTAFVKTAIAAIGASSFVSGMIMMWSGSLVEIGVGTLAGWALCDGSSGTPNLRDKFIIGAGNKAVGAVNAASTFDTTAGGTHSHTINATALSIAQLPAHDHGGDTGLQSANHTHAININTGTESATHTHGVVGGDPGIVEGYEQAHSTVGKQSGIESNTHFHNVSGNTAGVSANHSHVIPSEGSNQGHSHTMVGGGGSHVHTITAAQLRETVPYYALAYIMKL